VGPHCAGFGGVDEEKEKEDEEDNEFYDEGGGSAEFTASVDSVGNEYRQPMKDIKDMKLLSSNKTMVLCPRLHLFVQACDGGPGRNLAQLPFLPLIKAA